MPDDPSTRDRIWREIKSTHPTERWQAVWVATNLISQIPAEEWRAMHAGVCVLCSESARLYASGWYCTDHKPKSANA